MFNVEIGAAYSPPTTAPSIPWRVLPGSRLGFHLRGMLFPMLRSFSARRRGFEDGSRTNDDGESDDGADAAQTDPSSPSTEAAAPLQTASEDIHGTSDFAPPSCENCQSARRDLASKLRPSRGQNRGYGEYGGDAYTRRHLEWIEQQLRAYSL